MQEVEDLPTEIGRSRAEHPGVQAWVRTARSVLFLRYPTSTALLRPADAGTSSAVDVRWEPDPDPKGEEP